MQRLAEYKRKRDFTRTPEPHPGRIKKTKTLSYLIQKHDATHLHYDFRLELNGALLSWAVTRGPSLNPADKRLAVRTEDHPLSYGTFEGTIPKGQYGGGTVMLWDNGTWEPKGDAQAGLKKGHLSFTLHGKRLKGDWALIRMRGEGKRENWLLIKENDDEASTENNEDFLEAQSSSVTTGRSMEDIAGNKPKKKTVKSPMKKTAKKPASAFSLKNLMSQYHGVQLATLVDQPPQGEGWVHEIKFDGYRLLGFLSDGKVALLTRNGHDWTDKFPAIRDALANLRAASAVIDMEAVVVDKIGKTSFQALQAALGEGGDPGSIVAYAFDLLHLDGEDLSSLSLIDRKQALKDLLKKSAKKSTLLFSEHIAGHGDKVIRKSCSLGLEGIISKQAKDGYTPGRGKSWLKSKCIKRQEFIILGYAEARKGERAVGALYLGYYDKKQLMYAGKVGTGFTMKDAQILRDKLDKIKTTEKPALNEFPGIEKNRVRWVRQRLLCEIAFTEWTSDGHIRHPSFQGLREDKPAQAVVHEKAVHLDKGSAEPQTGSALIGGVSISHPDRIIFEDIGVTKGELAAYYDAVAPWMMEQLENRPLSLLRCPSGISGQCFFQRSAGTGLGSAIFPFKWKHKGKAYEYLYIKDKKGLLELVQMGVIEIHLWGARIKSIDYPDRVIFDLDPDPSVPFEAVKLAAQDVRKRLRKLGLESFLKCTGGKGLHVTVPLAEKDSWPKVKEWAAGFANEMAAEVPEAYVATMSKAKRTGRIFIDYFRNDYTATAIADYAVRARPGAHVALPLEWKDLKRLTSADAFNIRDVLALAKKGKLAAGFKKIAQRIPA